MTEKSSLTDQKINSADLFYGAMLHKIKSPLTVISGYADLLADSEPMSESNRERTARKIQDTCSFLVELINSDLLFIKDHLTGWKSNCSWRDIGCQITTIIEQMTKLVDNRTIFIQAEDQLPIIAWIDPEFLSIVIHHLLENAIQYSPQQTTISLDLRRTGDRAILSIQNFIASSNPQAWRDLLFQPFQSSGASSGLGLHIVSEYMRQMGGDVEFTKVSPNKIILKLNFASQERHSFN